MVGLHPPLLQQVAVKLGHLHSMTMKAYSVDLRTKVVESVRRGIAKSETARRFGVSRSTVNRYLRRLDEIGSLAPKQRPGKRPKLDLTAMRLLEEDVSARPWATHRQRSEFLFGVCGVMVSEATICRSIKRLGHSRKKDRQELANGTSG
jgi:transposase